MELGQRTLSELFIQLGLNNSKDAIQSFINDHQLDGLDAIEKASFWTPNQKNFIKDAWLKDSDWVGAIDELNVALQNEKH
jgi:hypothetical protein